MLDILELKHKIFVKQSPLQTLSFLFFVGFRSQLVQVIIHPLFRIREVPFFYKTKQSSLRSIIAFGHCVEKWAHDEHLDERDGYHYYELEEGPKLNPKMEEKCVKDNIVNENNLLDYKCCKNVNAINQECEIYWSVELESTRTIIPAMAPPIITKMHQIRAHWKLQNSEFLRFCDENADFIYFANFP